MEKRITVSACGRFHLMDGRPLYEKKFLSVLKFHEPGLAPVYDETGAYHISMDGEAAYGNRYTRTFGFYDGRAAVESGAGAFHVLPNGLPAYKTVFQWCGNYQEEKCVVQDFDGAYFHINKAGTPLYEERYVYAGDYKDDIAVVCNESGQHSHINEEGKFIHGQWFDQLDVFHKGFARAKDKNGWFHVTKAGKPLYEERFASIEPFYNGVAYVEKKDGGNCLLSENGLCIKEIGPAKAGPDFIGELSNDSVGFWKLWAIRAALDLGFFRHFPSTSAHLRQQTLLEEEKILRLLRGLWELGIVEKAPDGVWALTEKGACLRPTAGSFMPSAVHMWCCVSAGWQDLARYLSEPNFKRRPSFKELEADGTKVHHYLRALDGYNAQDFQSVGTLLDWSKHERIAGFGRASLTILPKILDHHKNAQVQFIGEPFSLMKTAALDKYKPRLQKLEGGLQQPLAQKQDAILLPRYLHYWPDPGLPLILSSLKQSLRQNGKAYIFEMVLEESAPFGSLFDLNMLVETGGKVRTLQNWKTILSAAGMVIENVQSLSPCLTLMTVGVNG